MSASMSFSLVFPIICLHFPRLRSFANLNGLTSFYARWQWHPIRAYHGCHNKISSKKRRRKKTIKKPNRFQVFFHSTFRWQRFRRIRCGALVCALFRLQFKFPISHHGHGLSFIFRWRPHLVDLFAHNHRQPTLRHTFAFRKKKKTF